MATESVKLLIEAESQVEAETAKAEAELKKVEAAIEQETLALKRYKIAVTEGAEALDVFNLQLKGIDEQTAKTIAAERALIREMERVKKEAEKPVKTPEGVSAGKGTKTAADFVRTIGSLTGSNEIAQFAGGLGELSEKTEQFAEAGKKGGAGALALKAGIVAAVAAVAFTAGKFLGDIIFQTDKWNRELELAKKRSDELNASLAKAQALRFSDAQADIAILGDPEEQQKAYEELFASVEKELAQVQARKQRAEKDVIDLGKQAQQVAMSAGVSVLPTTKINAAFEIKALKESSEAKVEEVRLDNERIKVLQQQREELQRTMTVEKERAERAAEQQALQTSKEYVESLREQLALLQATGQEALNVQAEQSGAVGADVGEAAMLLEQIEAQKALIEAEKEAEAERKRIAEEAEAKSKRIQELRDNELEKLEQERIALLQGKEAADAFALAKQGLSQADAEAIAAARAEVELLRTQKQEQEQNAKARDSAMSQPQQAQLSRFLTRGNTDDKTAKLVELGKKQLALQERGTKATEKIAQGTGEQGVKLRLETVG